MNPLLLALACVAADPPPASAFDAAGEAAVHDLVVLGETRPVLLRLRVLVGDRPARSAWDEAVRAYHAKLDRNGDGKLTAEEANANGLALVLPPPANGANAPRRAEADRSPKDGNITVDELAEALRETLVPFEVHGDGPAGRRTDALFDHLDRDRDGQITRAELATVSGSLRRLDRDDDERIGSDEVAPGETAATVVADAMMGRPTRQVAAEPAFAIVPGESPLRIVRALLKKYDTGSTRGPGRPDGKLSPEEFAVPAAAFAEADTNRDGSLNSPELRGYLEKAPRDVTIDLALAPDAPGRAVARGGGEKSEGIAVRQVAEGVVEVDLGLIRLDLHADDGGGPADAARRALRAAFQAADGNGDGYVESSELTLDDGQASPLTGPFAALDRDHDGKLYPREVDESVALQSLAARGRLTLTASDEGRALFGLLDRDRDRQLGAREVLDTPSRVSDCDRDGDGRVTPEEIPHHIRLTLARGEVSNLLNGAPNAAVAASTRRVVVPSAPRPTAGPDWFRKMDRNRDGDVSRREFLGSRDQFDRIDRDGDGLVSPDEAEAARPVGTDRAGG